MNLNKHDNLLERWFLLKKWCRAHDHGLFSVIFTWFILSGWHVNHNERLVEPF
ncbi:hypothetical protein [Mesobacillus foraminis]|uniref:hypothetical protein n=1 Tax=Mesobacillus foraminis TaxID=279826 RepID=UPI001304841B|nr:hypothetical protein [Mesobacillus foraminis]